MHLPFNHRALTSSVDTPVGECARLMRESNTGYLLLTAQDDKENLVGIFTERDLLRNLESIQGGDLWLEPVRQWMSTRLFTVEFNHLEHAPRIMMENRIRHLPVVKTEKGKQKFIGIISQDDLFRMVMRNFGFNLEEFFAKSDLTDVSSGKLAALFSKDQELKLLVENNAHFDRHIFVESILTDETFNRLPEIFSKFDLLLFDLDQCEEIWVAKLLAHLKSEPTNKSVFIAYSLPRLSERFASGLKSLNANGQIHLLAKPLSVGNLMDKFFSVIKSKA